MSDHAARYAAIAAGFTRRVEAVPPGAWDDPAPCEGWVARDVVRHLVEWIPAFFYPQWDVVAGTTPTADEDPAGAWASLDATLRGALADPAVAQAERDTRMGRRTFAETLDMIATTDVFLHTWDLARATGGDERLDPDEVHTLYEGMLPLDEMLRTSGHYGARVEVSTDADEQTKLLAFIGRVP